MSSAPADIASLLESRQARLVQAITDAHYARRPELATRYGPEGRKHCEADTAYHLTYLGSAASVGRPDVFVDYVLWAAEMLEARSVPRADLVESLQVMRGVLAEALPDDVRAPLLVIIDAAAGALEGAEHGVESFIGSLNPRAQLAHDYLDALLDSRRHDASRLILDAVAAGAPLREVYLNVFQNCQRELGRLWQLDQITVAQEHYCTAATQLIMSQLYPHVFTTRKNGHSMVATCVSGDLHELGVRMVADFFEMEGWDTTYLGANTPHDAVLETVRSRRAGVLAVSATIGFHVDQVASLIRALRKAEDLCDVRVLVGGYPFNVDPELWRQIGADGSASDAESAVAMATALVTTSTPARS